MKFIVFNFVYGQRPSDQEIQDAELTCRILGIPILISLLPYEEQDVWILSYKVDLYKETKNEQ